MVYIFSIILTIKLWRPLRIKQMPYTIIFHPIRFIDVSFPCRVLPRIGECRIVQRHKLNSDAEIVHRSHIILCSGGPVITHRSISTGKKTFIAIQHNDITLYLQSYLHLMVNHLFHLQKVQCKEKEKLNHASFIMFSKSIILSAEVFLN